MNLSIVFMTQSSCNLASVPLFQITGLEQTNKQVRIHYDYKVLQETRKYIYSEAYWRWFCVLSKAYIYMHNEQFHFYRSILSMISSHSSSVVLLARYCFLVFFFYRSDLLACCRESMASTFCWQRQYLCLSLFSFSSRDLDQLIFTHFPLLCIVNTLCVSCLRVSVHSYRCFIRYGFVSLPGSQVFHPSSINSDIAFVVPILGIT